MFQTGRRNVSLDSNLITVRIPIYLMALDSVPVGVSRDIAYVLTIGTSKIWTGIQSVKIGAQGTTPAGAAVTISAVATSLPYLAAKYFVV